MQRWIRHLPKQHPSCSGKLGKNTQSGSESQHTLLVEPLVYCVYFVQNTKYTTITAASVTRSTLREGPVRKARARMEMQHLLVQTATPITKATETERELGPALFYRNHHISGSPCLAGRQRSYLSSKEPSIDLWHLSLKSQVKYEAPVAQLVKNLPVIWETRVGSLGWEDPLEKGMATHSSILAWRMPWRERPGGLQSTG